MLGILFSIAILTACGPSQAELNVNATQAAADISATQRALFPSATSTIVQSPTAKATSTMTPEPSATATQVLPTQTELEQAVTALRRLDYENLTDAQADELNQAADTIINAGVEGARILKQELAVIEQSSEQDTAFKLLAAWCLWDIGALDEVDTIVKIWSAVPEEDRYYNMLLCPGLQAAATQDPRALPMLELLLSDKEGSIWFEMHYTEIDYPTTIEFYWGVYGSQGLPRLYELLQTSTDPTVIASCIYLLSQAQYLPALPQIREAVYSDQPEIRDAAIDALGLIGHPDDYQLLISGLDAPDDESYFSYVYAIVEFGDIQAVPNLVPLLKSDNKDVRWEVAWGFGNNLASPEGLVALKDCVNSSTDQDLADYCESKIDSILESEDLTWDKYASLPLVEQEKLTTNFRDGDRILKTGERAITHYELLEVVAEWRDTGRIASERGWDWVETRHILPAATGDDINLLIDGKAKFYLRVSDECLDEVAIVNDLIKWIGRSRYGR
jgi:hypothetical protein